MKLHEALESGAIRLGDVVEIVGDGVSAATTNDGRSIMNTTLKLGEMVRGKLINAIKYNVSSSQEKFYFTLELYNPQTQKFELKYVNKNINIEVSNGEYKDKVNADFNSQVWSNPSAYIRGNRHTIGSDPEMFVVDKDNNIIPAFTFLKDKKTNPDVYWDGFQAEFAPSPAGCLESHLGSVASLISRLSDAAKTVGGTVSAKSTLDIPQELLESAKDEHVEFGCMPSFNAYGMTGHMMPGRSVNFRSAGGHLHFGQLGVHNDTWIKIVKMLDATIGVACVSFFAKHDDPRRRTMYGLAGEYRLPKHGMEYRVLSNMWLCHPTVANMVVDFARRVVNMGLMGIELPFDYDELRVIKIINECDVQGAQDYLNENKAWLKKIIGASYFDEPDKAEAVFNLFLLGIDAVVKNVDNVINNWSNYMDKRWVIFYSSHFMNGRKAG